MSQFEISLTINIIVLISTLILTIVFLKIVKVESRAYKLFFILYTIFWIPIALTRPYRGTIQNLIDPELLVWALVAYGLIGIFIRPFADFLALKIKKRKIVLQVAGFVILATFVPAIFFQNSTTNIIQAFGIGVGASAIGTYELMFKEQYGKSKSFLTVSILAAPPLIADFLTAPVQSIVQSSVQNTDIVQEKLMIYSILALLASLFLILFIFMSFFVKENRSYVGLHYGNEIINKENKNLKIFALITIVGIFILFIKFSNSGAQGTLQLQNLQQFTNVYVSGIEGYLSTIFSVSQLIGTFIFGYLLTKKVSKKLIFLLGISFWLVYYLITSFIANPIAYMSIHVLNGLGYGLLYNLMLGFILKLSFNQDKLYTPMGIYQSFLAIGITASSFFTNFIRSFFKPITEEASIQQLLKSSFILNFIIIGILIMLIVLFSYVCKIESKKNNQVYQSF